MNKTGRFSKNCIRCNKKFIPSGKTTKLCDKCWYEMKKINGKKAHEK
jgi:hypothetical protein